MIDFMVDFQKEEEQKELHRSVLNIIKDIGHKINGWQFKHYIFAVLFYRYLSENLTNYINELESENGCPSWFEFSTSDDTYAEQFRTVAMNNIGFFMLPSELFKNVSNKLKDDNDVGETLKTIFDNIEEQSNGRLDMIFKDFDVEELTLGITKEERNDTLSKLLVGVDKMNIGNYKKNTTDAFGDIYEFLMWTYSSNAGQVAGEYYTPQEVSELLTKITTIDKKAVEKVYDPACGSGSLLLNFAKVLGADNVKHGFYGQEINLTTYNLCRMNMMLHNVGLDNFDIALGDTLTNPCHTSLKFDAIVSNPPYSIPWNRDLVNDDVRFTAAGTLAPKGKADFAFVMHVLHSLSDDGVAAVVCFPGIMYRGGAEQKIRRYLVDNNFVDAVIQLPPDLFFGSSIATTILILKKNKKNDEVLFIDASSEFVKITNKNKLTSENVDNIIDVFSKRQDVKYFAKLSTIEDIRGQDYLLSVSTYVEPEDKREKIDINKLNEELRKIRAENEKLSREIDELINEMCEVNKDERIG